MTGASFPTPPGVSQPSMQVCAQWLLCHPLFPCPVLTLAAQELSLEQVSMGKTALLRPESSFRYVCRVSGFVSPSVLRYLIRKPSSPSCGVTVSAGWWQTSECRYLFPPEKVNAQHFGAVAPRLLKARTDGSGSVEEDRGRRADGSHSRSLC